MIEHPGFTHQSLLGCARLERAAQGGWQSKGAGNGVSGGLCGGGPAPSSAWGLVSAGTAAWLQLGS